MVRIRFLLGPAGSGKTQRCLSEAGASLCGSPEGDWLVFVAPKQATFQLERQLLSNPELKGYSRLQILSFERLARFALDRIGLGLPKLLSEQGRIMALRAILEEEADRLEIFGKSARRMGFVEEVSRQLREFQHFGLGADELKKLAEKKMGQRLRLKLRDFALILDRYNQWLLDHELQDSDSLLTIAAEALSKERHPGLRIEKLWLDGFAQMTPQERGLLRAVLPYCAEATLAFCTATDTRDALPWYSSWSMVQENFAQCYNQLKAALPEAQFHVEQVTATSGNGRFASAPLLAHIEHHWDKAKDFAGDLKSEVQIRQCATPEKEAMFCAREIRRHIHDGGRYREIALLLRNLDSHADILARVFTRYEIPFFLDRRESISHHPLAELTRGALHSLANDWRLVDVFRFLKSGLTGIDINEIDLVENAALEFGWTKKQWQKRFTTDPKKDPQSDFQRKINKSRLAAASLLRWLERRLGKAPDGKLLKSTFLQFWKLLGVETKLREWGKDDPRQAHLSVFDQMQAWLDNVELAFGTMAMPLQKWLPILESGLSSLTVGLIPPALDQVLIGSVDRSRNPDLKEVFVLGMNEGLFPFTFREPLLLNENERKSLDNLGCHLGGQQHSHLAGEQFYAYIACTRARERVTLTFSDFGGDGKALNPSRILKHLQHLCNRIEIQRWEPSAEIEETEHISELWPRLIRDGERGILWSLIEDDPDEASALRALRAPLTKEFLSPAMVRKLYGQELRTSISRLEEFANCPFKFFVTVGLRAKERKLFEFDAREEGSFQHEILAEFHRETRAEGKKWRDLTVEEARDRIGKIADRAMQTFRDGLLIANEENQFRARAYKASLQQFIGVVIGWMKNYCFDPMEVELGFGRDNKLEAWRIQLSGDFSLLLEGWIDRIDLCSDGETAYAVVIDYKSGRKTPREHELRNGLQQQLPAYLRALCGIQNAKEILGIEKIIPAGFFYVNLRGRFDAGKSRADVLAKEGEVSLKAYTHEGVFDLAHLDRLDPKGEKKQFAYYLTKEKQPFKNSFSARPSEDFHEWLALAEKHLTEWGTQITNGNVDILPLDKGNQMACDYCDYLSICRFDPWTQPHRVMKRK